MLMAALEHSDAILQHIFQHCKLLDWLVGLPSQVTPTPLPGQEAAAEGRASLRAGYMGHITHLANRLQDLSVGQEAVKAQMAGHEGWGRWVETVLVRGAAADRWHPAAPRRAIGLPALRPLLHSPQVPSSSLGLGLALGQGQTRAAAARAWRLLRPACAPADY
jgi:hypothetical protein